MNDPAELWDRASEAGRSAGRGFFGGLARVDAERAELQAELELLRARVSQLEWENYSLRLEFAKWTGVKVDRRGWGAE